jgi:hypothetical protein
MMVMKKYFVFIASFILLYIGFQLLSGMILTAFYTPDFSQIGTGSSQETTFGQATSMPLLVTMLVATSAYFLYQTIFKAIKN